jgi:hypothetical protein
MTVGHGICTSAEYLRGGTVKIFRQTQKTTVVKEADRGQAYVLRRTGEPLE